MKDTLTPIGHCKGVDIFQAADGQVIVIVDGNREGFKYKYHAMYFVQRLLQSHLFTANAGQLVSQ